MYTPTALQMHKPFFSGIEISSKLDYIRRVNVVWWGIRIPMLLIAAPAAYGVSQFAATYLPGLWHWLAGMAFESAYIGAIALADQQLDEEKAKVFGREITPSKILWWATNVVAVVCSMLSNLLFFANGSYAAITPEIATHALPLPLLGFVYSMLVHNYSRRVSAANRKEFERAPYACPCGRRFERVKQLNGHKTQCPIAKRTI